MMDRYFIRSHLWEMVNAKTRISETENMGPWVRWEDVEKLQEELEKLKREREWYKNLIEACKQSDRVYDLLYKEVPEDL